MVNKGIITGAQAHECFSACISNILQKKYSTITGNEMIINGRGFRVVYQEVPFQLMTQMFGANFIFMNRYGIGYERRKQEKSVDSEGYLNKLLENNSNVILKVNANSLLHNRVYKQVEEAPHYINVIRENDNSYEIIDGYVPTREASSYSGKIEKDVLFKAWKFYKNEAYIIYDNHLLNEELIFRDTMVELKNSINIYCNGKNKKRFSYGKAAILRCCDNLQYGICKEEAHMLNYQLKIWGFLSVKQMIIEIICGQDIFGDVVNQYQDIIDKWNNICLMILKVSISQRKERLNDLVEQMKRCVEEEEKVLRIIQYIISKSILKDER